MECPSREEIRLTVMYILDWIDDNKDEAVCRYYNNTREEFINYIYQEMLDYYFIQGK